MTHWRVSTTCTYFGICIVFQRITKITHSPKLFYFHSKYIINIYLPLKQLAQPFSRYTPVLPQKPSCVLVLLACRSIRRFDHVLPIRREQFIVNFHQEFRLVDPECNSVLTLAVSPVNTLCVCH